METDTKLFKNSQKKRKKKKKKKKERKKILVNTCSPEIDTLPTKNT